MRGRRLLFLEDLIKAVNYSIYLKGETFGAYTGRRSNHSIPKEISPEYSLEGLMLKAETPILWPPDAKNQLIGKDPDAGKD